MSLKTQVRHQESGVIVDVDNRGRIHLYTGHICSTQASHCGADNTNRTVFWGDVMFNDLADSADDAYEKGIDVSDPRLIMRDELQNLFEREKAIAWFNGVYPPDVAILIADALARRFQELLAESKSQSEECDFGIGYGPLNTADYLTKTARVFTDAIRKDPQTYTPQKIESVLDHNRNAFEQYDHKIWQLSLNNPQLSHLWKRRFNRIRENSEEIKNLLKKSDRTKSDWQRITCLLGWIMVVEQATESLIEHLEPKPALLVNAQ